MHLLLEAKEAQCGITITVIDDVRGLNRELILAKAVEKGLVGEDEAMQYSDQKIFDFILQAGFSTKEETTSISGRGVGLDALKTELDKLGGTIKIVSKQGQGASFDLYIPL